MQKKFMDKSAARGGWLRRPAADRLAEPQIQFSQLVTGRAFLSAPTATKESDALADLIRARNQFLIGPGS